MEFFWLIEFIVENVWDSRIQRQCSFGLKRFFHKSYRKLGLIYEIGSFTQPLWSFGLHSISNCTCHNLITIYESPFKTAIRQTIVENRCNWLCTVDPRTCNFNSHVKFLFINYSLFYLFHNHYIIVYFIILMISNNSMLCRN